MASSGNGEDSAGPQEEEESTTAVASRPGSHLHASTGLGPRLAPAETQGGEEEEKEGAEPARMWWLRRQERRRRRGKGRKRGSSAWLRGWTRSVILDRFSTATTESRPPTFPPPARSVLFAGTRPWRGRDGPFAAASSFGPLSRAALFHNSGYFGLSPAQRDRRDLERRGPEEERRRIVRCL